MHEMHAGTGGEPRNLGSDVSSWRYIGDMPATPINARLSELSGRPAGSELPDRRVRPAITRQAHRRSVLPDAVELAFLQSRVDHRVPNIGMAEVVLDGPGVDIVRGQLEATRMPEHMWMWFETAELRKFSAFFDDLEKPRRGHWAAALGDKYKAAFGIFTP